MLVQVPLQSLNPAAHTHIVPLSTMLAGHTHELPLTTYPWALSQVNAQVPPGPLQFVPSAWAGWTQAAQEAPAQPLAGEVELTQDPLQSLVPDGQTHWPFDSICPVGQTQAVPSEEVT